MMLAVVAEGVWVYDESVPKLVDVIALDYDYWYEIALADDELEPGEQAGPFSADGTIYYVRFRMAGSTDEPTWMDHGGFTTVDDAKRAAESVAPSPIAWLDPADERN